MRSSAKRWPKKFHRGQMKRPSSNLSGWPSKISPQQCSFTDQLREGKTAAHLPKTRRQRKAARFARKIRFPVAVRQEVSCLGTQASGTFVGTAAHAALP